MRALRYLLILIVILVLAVVAIPFVVPPDVIADQVVKLTKDKTGRDLSLGGDISFSFYPNIAVSMQDVSLSNPPDMPKGIMLTTGKLRLNLQLMPLLQGNIQVKTFELVNPRVNLLTDVSGKSNWDFSTPGDDGDTPTDPSASGDTDIGALSLDDIRIVDGIVRYLDETAGTAFEASQMNVALSLPDIGGDLNLSGSLVWQGEKVEIATTLGSIGKLNTDKQATIKLKLASTHITSTFDGIITLLNGFGLSGAIDVKTPSLRNLATWAGNPLAPGQGLNDFSAAATVKIGPGEITLKDAKIGLDGMRAQGNMTIQTTGARPLITASLGVDQIDLNKYIAESAGKSSKPSQSGWSEEPMNFSGLKAVDANLRMAASRILYKKVTVNNSELAVTIKDGQLNANLTKLNLYNGLAQGTLTLDGAAATPTIITKFSSQGISALPLLRDFAGFEWIEGTSKLTAILRATGASQKQLVQNLNGNVQVLFEDGALRGINIAQMMRGLGTNILSGWSQSEAQKTDFAALSASYKVTNGVAVNSDLKMLGPLVRLTGAGVVQMPNQWLDYTVDPKLVASLKGQGGAADLAGFNVPIKIKGPWSKPKIYPDIAGILDNPAEALKQLKGIGNIDPGKLGLKTDQILGGGTEAVENLGDGLQKTLKDVLKPSDTDDGGGLLNDVLKGLGNN